MEKDNLDNFDIDAFLAELQQDLAEDAEPAQREPKIQESAMQEDVQKPTQPEMIVAEESVEKSAKKSGLKKFLVFLGKFSLVLVETVLLLVVALYGVM